MDCNILIKNGTVITDGKPQKFDILVENGIIKELSDSIEPINIMETIDAEGKIILPGFIDLHTHGCMNIDINDAGVRDYEVMGRFYASQGVTGYWPTILTDTHEQMIACIKAIVEAKKEIFLGAKILGIHLEGPYLAKEYKGAMPEKLLRSPNLKELDDYINAAGSLPIRMTISPEVEGAQEFIKEAVKRGILISLGHTGACYHESWKCINNGASSATHTFNAMRLPHQHEPAISGAALESNIYCEAICDGLHLHPGMVRLLLKTKGYDRVVAVTDSIMATGLGDGKFKLGVNDIVVIDGDARLADGSSRAGSTLTMAKAFSNILEFTGNSMEEVVKLTSKNAADLTNMSDEIGTINVGKSADFIIIDDENKILSTYVEGKSVYRN